MYSSTFTFQFDGTDVTRYVDEGRFRHGSTVLANGKTITLRKPRGRIRLENFDRFWTDAKLAAIRTVTIQNDGVPVAVCAVSGYDLDSYRRQAVIDLESQRADVYDLQVSVLAGNAALDESAILARAGVTIDNKSPYNGFEMDVYGYYCKNLFRFIRDFSDFADVHISEAHDGSWVAVVPSTENRDVGATITNSSHLWKLRSAQSKIQRDWRRDSQIVHSLGGFPSNSYTQRLSGSGNTPVSVGGDWVSLTYLGDYEGQTKVWRVDVGRPDRYLPSPLPAQYRYTTATIDPDSPGGGQDWLDVFFSPGSRGSFRNVAEGQGQTEGRYSVWVRYTGSASDNGQSSFGFRISVLLESFYGAGGKIEQRFPASGSPSRYLNKGVLPYESSLPVFDASDTPAPATISPSQTALMNSKIARWESYTPAVVSLEFLADQETESDWHDIRDLAIGGIANIVIDRYGIEVSRRAWVMAKEWDYKADDISSVTIHFLSYREAISKFRMYRLDTSNPVFRSATSNPLFREI